MNISCSCIANRQKHIVWRLAMLVLVLYNALSCAADAQTSYFQPRQPAPSPLLGGPPLVVPPISFVDINSGRLGQLEINLQDGQFLDAAVDNLYLKARKLDLVQGELSSLEIDIKGGHFQDFTIDRLNLVTRGSLRFDTGILFNHRTLQFTSPAIADVAAMVSQDSLNRFLNAPTTLNRLSIATQTKAPLLNSLLGGSSVLGATFNALDLRLAPGNRVLLNMQTKIGMAELSLPVNFELTTSLELKDGWIALGNTHLATAGQEISPELSRALVEKVNGLARWGRQSDDINFSFTELRVLPGARLVLRGTAELRRLRFGANRP